MEENNKMQFSLKTEEYLIEAQGALYNALQYIPYKKEKEREYIKNILELVNNAFNE